MGKAGIGSFVFLKENESPVFFLQPRYFGKENWLYLKKVAIKYGNKVLEINCSASKIDRNTYPGGVEETTLVSVDDNTIQKLKEIVSAKAASIRLIGEKGFVSPDNTQTHMLVGDMQTALEVYELLSKALNNHIPHPSESAAAKE